VMPQSVMKAETRQTPPTSQGRSSKGRRRTQNELRTDEKCDDALMFRLQTARKAGQKEQELGGCQTKRHMLPIRKAGAQGVHIIRMEKYASAIRRSDRDARTSSASIPYLNCTTHAGELVMS
jgi:hypothetical protein